MNRLLILFAAGVMAPFYGSGHTPELKKMTAKGMVRPLHVYMLPSTEASLSFDTLIRMVDTLGSKKPLFDDVFAIPVKTDSTKPQLLIFKHFVAGTSNWKFMIEELYPNGNPSKMYCYDKKYRLQPVATDFYDDLGIQSMKKYLHGKPIKRWSYYNEKGQRVKKEVYRHGTLKRTKVFLHPHKTWMTIFAYRHKKGVGWKISS